MRNTDIALNLYEKQTLMQNRIASATALYHMVQNWQLGVKNHYGVDQKQDVNDPSVRQFHGIGDYRPVEEIVADVELLWAELKSEILDTVKPYERSK